MKNRGQVILETIAGLLVLFLLLAGVTKLFVWFGSSFAGRQIQFERTRQIGSKPISGLTCTMDNPDNGNWGGFHCNYANGTQVPGPHPWDGMTTGSGDDFAKFVTSYSGCSCHYQCDWTGCCIWGCSYIDQDCGNNPSSAWAIQSCTYTGATILGPSAGVNASDVQDLNYTGSPLNLTDGL